MLLNSMDQTIYIDNIARNIWKKRKAIRYTQEMLADRTGLSAQYIYLLENGKMKNPGVISLMVICKVLNCSLLDLLADKESYEVSA